MGGCATPGRHSTRCRSCRLPRALMLNGFAVQEFRLVYNNEGAALGIAIAEIARAPTGRPQAAEICHLGTPRWATL